MEDDIIVDTIISFLEDFKINSPDPRKLQFLISGFLEEKSEEFVSELWDLLVNYNKKDKGAKKIKKAREIEIDEDINFINKEIKDINHILGVIKKYEDTIFVEDNIESRSFSSLTHSKEGKKIKNKKNRIKIESSSYDSSSSLSSD